jgi:hypothetical protein
MAVILSHQVLQCKPPVAHMSSLEENKLISENSVEGQEPEKKMLAMGRL